tara:strand:+ start:398 stop:598 length:201 start_codon:yes stop_codon:yes gene_type:complete
MLKVMNAQEKELINKEMNATIGDSLELCEAKNFTSEQVNTVRKLLWKVHNQTVLLMNVHGNDKSSI